MKTYISHKKVHLTPMNRLDYTAYRSWELPSDEDGSDEGYLVEYLDGGTPNHPDHKGYISWSPKAQADAGYTEVLEDECPLSKSGKCMTFGQAVHYMKQGYRVQRAGWNGKGMFAYLVQGSTFEVNRAPLLGIYPEGTQITYNPHMDLRTANGTISTWAPSGSDALAEDWEILPQLQSK